MQVAAPDSSANFCRATLEGKRQPERVAAVRCALPNLVCVEGGGRGEVVKGEESSSPKGAGPCTALL